MKRVTGATLAAAILITGALPAGAMTIRSTGGVHRREMSALPGVTSWAATSTKGLALKNATDLGLLSAVTPLRIVVGLTANKSAAETELRHIYTVGDPQYHQFLTPAQYTAAFAPSAASVNAVVSYLNSLGFTNVQATPNNLLVRANGSASLVSSAFNTSLHSFNLSGSAFFANVTPAMVPAQLSGIVTAVLGLENIPAQIALRHPNAKNRARLHAEALAIVAKERSERLRGMHLARAHTMATTLASGIQPCTGLQWIPGYGPPPVSFPIPQPPVGPCLGRPYTTNDMRVAYDDQGGSLGSNTNVAVFTEGNTTGLVSDLRLNERDMGLRQVPVNMVPVDFQSQDTYGQGEWTMDTQASTGIAGDVKSLTQYNVGSLDDNDTTMAYNRWVTDDVAQVANASFGECEYQAYLDASMALDDEIFQEGALQGQTLFASSGDSGSSCGFNVITNGLGPIGPVQVEYPATSPYVMAAGGTSLFTTYTGDNYGAVSWYSGGGGLSLFEAPEYWQYPYVPEQCIPVYCSIGGPGLPVAVTAGALRSVPDVAMDADADVAPVIYYEGGAITENAGTSLASPLSTGTFARLHRAFDNKLGFAAVALYTNYGNNGGAFGMTPALSLTTPIGAFQDIQFGANGAYTALPGFDQNTGLGSFDINNMLVSFGV